MPVIVDGDNLLGSWPGRSRSDDERRALAREIARYAASDGKSILLCYDGTPPEPHSLGPDVLFSGRGRSADDLILGRLKGQTDRRGYLVVTNDRSLADRCRWLGAKVERCDVFRKRLRAERAKGREPVSADPKDVDYWMEVFGEEE